MNFLTKPERLSSENILLFGFTRINKLQKVCKNAKKVLYQNMFNLFKPDVGIRYTGFGKVAENSNRWRKWKKKLFHILPCCLTTTRISS